MTDLQLGAADIQRLRRVLDGTNGVNLSYYTMSFLARRIAARMRQLGVGSQADYLARLESDRAELEILVAALTINVTEFFRDPGVYVALREAVIPALLRGVPRTIKVWSAGCATGEEPYTAAMIFEEAIASHPGYSYKVYASDINIRQVEIARSATYPVKALAHVPERYLRRFFLRHADGWAAVAPEIKTKVHVSQHDLSNGQAAPAAGFDLILCRNVMIYFLPEAKEKMLMEFQRVLAPEGFLILGGAEVILRKDRFVPFGATYKIYRAVKPAA